jgi:electron transfer flavoprotein beta subunit
MRIVVALKQVPSHDSLLRLNAAARWIQETDLTFETNEPDAYALEEALRLKAQHGGEVVVLTVGPPRVAQAIRGALAKGADRAIHIEEENLQDWDVLGVAQLMARALEPEQPDLILTGLQSDDLGHGQTGVVLAELMGLPHATIIMQVELNNGSLRVKRELEEGWFQYVQIPLPALLAVQSGISRLRYATLMGIRTAQNKPVRRLRAAELGVKPNPCVSVSRVYLPHHIRETQMLEGSPKRVAAKLVERLRSRARVL